MTGDEIQRRKNDHLRIVAHEDVQHAGSTLLECVQLLPDALPELALTELDVSVEFFGKRLSAPLMIASMTGGAERAGELNRALAEVARATGIALAVGSQRVMLTHPEAAADFEVRQALGDGVLLGNIGAQQLVQHPLESIVALVRAIDADGICVHLNPTHELAQDAGDSDFRGLLNGISGLAGRLQGRVLVKETGAGIAPSAARRLAACGIRYIDVAGAGGTSWPKVESYRSSGELARAVGETFADWGMPTAASLIAARRVCPDEVSLIASGGIRTGLDVARAIASGADVAGLARAVLAAYLERGTAGAVALIERVIHELRVAMLLVGCRELECLRSVARVYTGELRDWLAALEIDMREGED